MFGPLRITCPDFGEKKEKKRKAHNNSETKYTSFYSSFPFATSHTLKTWTGEEETESSHRAHTVGDRLRDKNAQSTTVNAAAFEEEEEEVSERPTCTGTCSETAGENTVCTTLLADGC